MAAVSHPMSIAVVACFIPLSFQIVLKFYDRLNENQKITVSLPSLLLLPTFPSSWLLLGSQVLCHPDGKSSVTALISHLHPPQYLWGFFERLYLSAPMNGRLPERIIRSENICMLGEKSALITHGQK